MPSYLTTDLTWNLDNELKESIEQVLLIQSSGYLTCVGR